MAITGTISTTRDITVVSSALTAGNVVLIINNERFWRVVQTNQAPSGAWIMYLHRPLPENDVMIWNGMQEFLIIS